MKSDNAMSHRLHASHLKLGYDNKIIADDLRRGDPRRRLHGDRRAERLRQIDAAARPVPSAETQRRRGDAGRQNISSFATKALARELACCRKPRSHRTALPWQTWCRAAAIRTRAC